MPATTLDPRTALVVVDLQRGTLAAPLEPHPAADVVARNARLADAFRALDLPVVLVRMTQSIAADVAPGRTTYSVAAVVAGHPPRNFPDGFDELAEEVVRPGDTVVTKRTWGAFIGTDLDLQLRRRGITQVVLSGLATSIGVESTARQAYDLGYHVTLVTDAMSDRSADDHEHAVTSTFPKLAETGTTEEVLTLLG